MQQVKERNLKVFVSEYAYKSFNVSSNSVKLTCGITPNFVSGGFVIISFITLSHSATVCNSVIKVYSI